MEGNSGDNTGQSSTHQQNHNNLPSQRHTPSRPSSPSAGMRRARVDDDDDEAETASPERNRPRTNSSDPTPQPSRMQQRTTMQFLLSTPQQQQPFAHFSIVMDAPNFNPNVGSGSHQQQQQQPAVQEHQFTFDTGPMSRERLATALSNLATRFGPGVMMMSGEREPDIERGETILKALESVPRGLIQRMVLVGGVLGGADSQPISDEQVLCPVCWESLLESGSFGAEAPTSNDQPQDLSSEKAKDSILTLPCLHVFHGSCLLPWLSRQTTCPSCRFNLDPEHLTSKRQGFIPVPVPNTMNIPGLTGVPAHHPNPVEVNQVDVGTQPSGPVPFPDAPGTNGEDAPTRGPTLVGAMSMVFAVDPTDATPDQQSSNGNQFPESSNGTQQSRRNAFPPGIPPEFQTILTTMFGDSLIPVNPGAAAGNEVGAQTSTAAESSENTGTTEAIFSQTVERQNSSAIDSSMRPGSNEQDEESNESSGEQNSTSNSIMSALLGALFGRRAGQSQTAPDSNQTDGTTTLGGETNLSNQAESSSQPLPGSNEQQTAGQRRVPLPFFPNPAVGINGNVGLQMPTLSRIPRPFTMPPFPPNMTSTIPPPYAFPRPPEIPRTPFFSSVNQPGIPNPQQWQQRMFNQPGVLFPHPVPRERKKWSLPERKGASFRERVEEKERSLGLRCNDPSCGLAPTDEVPQSITSKPEMHILHKEGEITSRVCEHAFHSGCLVSSARVAGFGPTNPEEVDIEAPCVVCRTHGYIGREIWDDGAKQLSELLC